MEVPRRPEWQTDPLKAGCDTPNAKKPPLRGANPERGRSLLPGGGRRMVKLMMVIAATIVVVVYAFSYLYLTPGDPGTTAPAVVCARASC